MAPQAGPWWRHAVIYEIYVRSFQDSNGDGIGDLRGITQRLPHLQQLGVDAIWLTPFFPSPNADFGYDVADYTGVAPEYGTLADWDELVEEARQRGLRVLVDLVLNHSSDQHPWFQASRSSLTDPQRDWYVWRDGAADGGPPTNWRSVFGGPAWTFDALTGQWYYHVFLPQQPDLNWAHPGLREAMFEAARFWLRRGASGFRLDATPFLFEDPAWPQDPDPEGPPSPAAKPYNANRPENHGVLRALRALVDGFPGHPVLLGESATESLEELRAAYGAAGDEMQLPMNFRFGRQNRLDAAAFKRHVDEAQLCLAGHTPVFFLGNHDHRRQASVFGDGRHDDAIARLTAALTLTQPGAVLIYYGDEIGMRDLPDAELAAAPLGPQRPRADDRDRARTPMQWAPGPGGGFTRGTPWLPLPRQRAGIDVQDQQGDPASMLHWVRALLALRRDEPLFRDGAYLALESGNAQVFAFARTLADGATALVVLNTSAAAQAVVIDGLADAAPGPWRVLLASPATAAPAGPAFAMAAFGVLIAARAAPSSTPRPASLP